ASVTAYDPGTNTWQSWPDVPQARTSATAKSISAGRFVFCCGSAGTSNSNGWLASPAPPVPPQPRPRPAALSHLTIHPSTVRAARAGRVSAAFRLNRSAKVEAVLRHCLAPRCTVVARTGFSAPPGPSHVSLLALAHRRTLPPAHYRLTLMPAAGRAMTVRLVLTR
ncbi:MAG: hypothetical protein QOJ83_2576, partial [Frankiales bacterium]|nr:hypothetical protein [Frankiales bacterium]